MSRKTAIIIIAIVAVLLIAAVVFFYFFYGRGREELPPEFGEFPSAGEEEFPPEVVPPTELPSEAGPFRPILRQLATEPVAGAVTGTKSDETIVRYLARATGNAYEIPAEGGAAKRLTNTTIPKIYEALWARNGVSVLARYLKEDGETIETFSGSIKPRSGGEGDLAGVFLPQNITALALSPTGDEVFYIREERGGAVGIRAALNGNGKTEVFRSPLREWSAAWPAEDAIVLTAKPSALSWGLAELLHPTTGRVTPLLSRITGLTVLSDGALARLLYSASAENRFSLSLFERESRRNTPLPIATLPEKCVFAQKGERVLCGVPREIPPGSYPDAWYQGVIRFADEIWEVETADAIPRRIIDASEEARTPIDLVEPRLSSDGKFLVFTNRNDDTLWSVQLAP